MTTQRERILTKALHLRQEEVYVEEWDETVYIKELTGEELVKFTSSTFKQVDDRQEAEPIDAMVNILFYCLIDEDGDRLFTKTQLKRLPGIILLKLGGKALKFNGLDQNRAISELAEDLKKDQGADFSSD